MWCFQLQISIVCFAGYFLLFSFSLVFCSFSLVGFGLVPRLCIYFSLFFFNKFLEFGGMGWRSLGVPT